MTNAVDRFANFYLYDNPLRYINEHAIHAIISCISYHIHASGINKVSVMETEIKLLW